ncbi:MAG: hypothetical protein UR69_C0002G0019 [Candidatus Moranbacteria bacterium GW2011_GWE2_35_2-]|nr:MAG: hypothetical protein UR69_C0002G0019 [Candidatus Moranbacteria bacterium GW2011_GWE2_35_2-]KKQ05425.1 MAG: hypothetical protein US15_C0030G0003 [Candidatus Moranbacteria bacterium GW2011_GWF1_36_4]KKQ22632.1 MAG: hypothetical protein US37_C0002G0257 [Candidatus Moranbacteria bacterium GW2011_GWF2_37_11]KKQ29035.1 MAG: hypothetical protein US44_C0004G0079 [Candidatus Moranbacteria bacterium GW2011_GWD1_37_17]KKQ30429.1 MAG: hypothetical protein US47_C0002G0019 [Candidatus Moranbacteria b
MNEDIFIPWMLPIVTMEVYLVCRMIRGEEGSSYSFWMFKAMFLASCMMGLLVTNKAIKNMSLIFENDLLIIGTSSWLLVALMGLIKINSRNRKK